MQIGQLGRETATKVTTIRFYEQIGLMDQAERTASGRRSYRQGDLERLHFIRNARRLGFSVDEIRSLIALANQPEQNCAAASRIAARHLAEIEERLRQLTALRDELAAMSDPTCDATRMSECRVIQAIGSLSVEAGKHKE